jgi:hypothetical protein
MSIQLPYIEKIESASELLDLLCDPKKFAERLKTLEQAQEAVNVRLKRYEDFDKIETYKNAADAKVKEAEEKRAEVAEYVKRQRASADTILGKAMAKDKTAQEFHDEVHKRHEARENKLDLWDQELTKREDAVAKDLAAAVKSREDAVKLVAEANSIRAEYEAKHAKLKELAA